jgi:hypothetical protein
MNAGDLALLAVLGIPGASLLLLTLIPSYRLGAKLNTWPPA